MDTLKVKVAERTYYVHHNSDWSGDATITSDASKEEIVLPGTLLAACGFDSAVQEAVSALEQLKPPRWDR